MIRQNEPEFRSRTKRNRRASMSRSDPEHNFRSSAIMRADPDELKQKQAELERNKHQAETSWLDLTHNFLLNETTQHLYIRRDLSSTHPWAINSARLTDIRKRAGSTRFNFDSCSYLQPTNDTNEEVVENQMTN